MSEFLSELVIKCCPTNENLWELENPLVYESDLVGRVTVPAGFITDLASTRHIPLVSLIWGDRAHREAVIHDYLYCYDSVPVVWFSKANEVFKEAMETREKGIFVRYPMFWGVWIGGWWRYHKRSVNWKPGDDAPVCIEPNPTIQP